MLIGEVWAAKLPTGLTSVGLDSAGGPSPLKNLSAATFTLPPELGYVQESNEVPNSVRTVIHIQDAHCNYAAQKSISELLGYLTNEYGINRVNCEGASEGYDLSPFTNIKKSDTRAKTADFFVKEGVVSAAEYYAVINPEKVNLWGVEDPDLYLKNLKVYRDSLAHKAEVDKYLKSIGYIIDNLKLHIYSSELLELDKQYTGYKESKISFKEYILYLISMAQKRMVDIKSFSNIYLLSQTLGEEDKINFKRANSEKDEVVDKLKKSLSRNELEDLMVMVGKLNAERISQSDFYTYLVKKARSVKLDISGYPELQRYMIYISLYSALDRTKVGKEIDALEYRIKASLYENDTQRELGVLSKNLAITRNIFNISLTRDDYLYYKENRASFSVANYISFIEKKAPLYKISATLDKNIGMLDVYRDSMDQFYECSLERDKAFIKNIRFTDHDRPSSIIITGGFHTENLRELFKNEKVSYISIMPKFRIEKGYESPYLKRLAGQRTALENVVDTAIPAVLNLAVVEMLANRLAFDVEGPAKMNLFRLEIAIVEAFMEDRPFVLKINKGVKINGRELEEEKFITFAWPTGAPAPTPSEPTAKKPEAVNATLIAYGPRTFEFTPEPAVSGGMKQVVPPVGTTESAVGLKEPVAQKSGYNVTGPGAPLYNAAVISAPAIEKELRHGAWTLDISPARSEEDISPTTDNNRYAEQILNDKKGHNIHAKCYLAKGDWMKELKKVVRNNMNNFIEAAQDSENGKKARMVIRIMTDERAAEVNKIRGYIKSILIAYYNKHGLSARDARTNANNMMKQNLRLVPISIENVAHFNPSVDLFVDIGMMEIDRYIRGDYQGEIPDQLKANFLALLKGSITNFDDFKKSGLTDIQDILKAIFRLKVILKINWKVIDDWKKANKAVLESV